VTLYENSQFGNEATVVIETPDSTLIGVITDGPFLTDGTIDEIVVPLAPENNPEDIVGSATVSGSYTVSGRVRFRSDDKPAADRHPGVTISASRAT